MKILQVADRPGWAVDRLSKPLAEMYDNVDMSYFYTRESRFLNTGYSKKQDNTLFTPEMAQDYDIIHFHYAKAANIYTQKQSLKDKRLIVTKHTEREEDIDWSRFDDVICPTKYVMEQLKNYDTNLHYVPHGIDLNKYKCQFQLANKDTIGFVGRIIEHKNYHHILNSAVEAKLRLISCGYVEDPYLMRRPRIKEKITQGVDYDFVTFLPENLMSDFYARMGIFICGSEPHIEVGPLPVMEAMACGIPVISTEVGWLKDYGEHEKTYWKLDTGPERWGRIFRNVYNRQDIRGKLRENALQLIQNFSIEKYAENLMNIYEK